MKYSTLLLLPGCVHLLCWLRSHIFLSHTPRLDNHLCLEPSSPFWNASAGWISAYRFFSAGVSFAENLDSSCGCSWVPTHLHPFQLPKLGKAAGNSDQSKRQFRPPPSVICLLPSYSSAPSQKKRVRKQTSQLVLSLGETLIHVLYIVNPFRNKKQLDLSSAGVSTKEVK